MFGQVKGDFILIHHPIEVAPDFTAVEFFGSFHFRQAANGGDDAPGNGYVGIMLVSQIMGVNKSRPGAAQQGGNIGRLAPVSKDP